MSMSRSSRRHLDFYPTPEAASHALADWLIAKARLGSADRLIDPAAGEGAIIRAFRKHGRVFDTHWSAIEIDPSHKSSLDEVAEWVIIADALQVDWYNAHVVANPPFSLLDEFWQRICRHRQTYQRWCACLMPVTWWHAQKRRDHVRPDVILALGWRPSFVQAGGSRNGTQDYAWCVLAPHAQALTRWERIEKPEPASA